MRNIFLFVWLWCMVCVSQARPELNEIQIESNDSLQNKTLRELALMFWRGEDLDSIVKVKVRKAYMYQAKKTENPIAIADGYQMFLHMNKGQFENYIKYSDSIINVTKDLKNHHYPTTGYIFKSNALQALERYNEALETILIAIRTAENNNFFNQTMYAEFKLAELKGILGKDSEAFEIYKKHYSVLVNQDSIPKNDQFYIGTVYKLADSYNKIKNYDSAHYYIKKGIKYSLGNYYRHFYPELVFTSGVNNYHKGKYKAAIDSLHKTLSLLDDNADDIKVRVSYLYLGKSYKKLKNEAKSFEYLRKVDSVTNKSNYRLEIREAFELLKDHYNKTGNKSELIKLLEKWIGYEKIRQEKYDILDQEITEKYDFPKLIKEKEVLLNQTIRDNKTTKSKMLYIGGLVLLIISLLYFLWYKRKKDAFEDVLDEQLVLIKKLEENQTPSTSKSKLALSKDLKQEILEKLHTFEKDLGYLKNDLTLVKVSKKLRTNSTYLSKVINEEKQKSFSNYINDLRIAYCIEQIKNDKKFRQYSISSMAKEVGFNNIQSFAKAFSKTIGVNPAEYIKNIADY